MFSIANNVAYEGLMVYAKTSVEKTGTIAVRDVLGESRWFDVRGTADDKWSAEEGRIVVELLWKLARSRAPADLYIISPFVVVAQNLRKAIKDNGVLENWVANPGDWLKERVGLHDSGIGIAPDVAARV